jgi:hypothetical protein
LSSKEEIVLLWPPLGTQRTLVGFSRPRRARLASRIALTAPSVKLCRYHHASVIRSEVLTNSGFACFRFFLFWPFIQISSNDAMLLAKTQIFAIGHGFDQSMSNAGDLRNVLIDWGDYFIRINPHKIFWILATSHVRALHLDAPQSDLRTRGS